MFGLPSLSKLLLLVAIIAAVWYGFKFVGQLDKKRKQEGKLRERQTRKQNGGRTPAADSGVEEMVQCPACQAYVAAKNASNCGRPDCPY